MLERHRSFKQKGMFETKEKQQVPPLRYAPVGMTIHFWVEGRRSLSFGCRLRETAAPATTGTRDSIAFAQNVPTIDSEKVCIFRQRMPARVRVVH